MSFNTLEYWLFLPAAVTAYYIVPYRLRNLVLLAASYLFYYWALDAAGLPAQLLLVLVGVTLASYCAGLLAPRLSGRVKTAVKVLAILLCLGTLLYFKYTNFFFGIVNDLAGGRTVFRAVSLLVPVGISVFTFQSIGYILDVNNGRCAPERNLVVFALFVSFFPQITSGPIARSNRLLPQFREKHRLRYQNILFGGQRFVWGLFKKTVAADWLMLVINSVYDNLSSHAGATLQFSVLIYALMVYLDFSAYTDMALGSAKMFGFSLQENFAAPFYATNFSGLWKRWHMSLTSWLTDYVFTPLVWSRWVNKLVFGKKWNDHAPHIIANLFLVFLVSGFWHGPTINFVIWGLLQGLFRAGEEWLHKIRKPRKLQNRLLGGLVNTGKRLVVYLLYTFSHIFFWLPTAGEVRYLFSHLFDSFHLSDIRDLVYTTILGAVSNYDDFRRYTLVIVSVSVLLIAVLDWFVIYKAPKTRTDAGNVLQHLPAVPRWLCYFFIVAAILFAGYFGASVFIYGGIMG